MRCARTASKAENADALYAAAEKLSGMAKMLSDTDDVDVMRGIEGAAANAYFSVFDTMLGGKNGFVFETRSGHPVMKSMPSYRLSIPCSHTTAFPLWKRLGWILRLDIYIHSAQAALPLRWI